MSSRLYLYGVVEPVRHHSLGTTGVDGATVLVVPEGEFGVAMSSTTREQVTPTKADLTAHQRVLEYLLEECDAVLPFSFGTLATDREAVRQLVTRAAENFRESMGKVRGCIEVGLKVLWQRDAMLREVEAITGPVAGGQGGSRSEGERRNRAIQVGQVVEQVSRSWAERYVPMITAALAPHCRDWREGELIGPTMFWNGSFLVQREHESEFRDALAGLDRRLGNRLAFHHVAPMPPYNFVQLKIAMAEEETE